MSAESSGEFPGHQSPKYISENVEGKPVHVLSQSATDRPETQESDGERLGGLQSRNKGFSHHDTVPVNVIPDAESSTPTPTSQSELKSSGTGADDKERQAIQPSDQSQEEKPFSVFTKNQKWAIIVLAALSGLFSPLGAFIYLPALPTLVTAFGSTSQKINLTITVYQVFQGITPSIWGILSDTYGRRPIYISCLTLFTLSQLALALIPASSSGYVALLIFRMLTAAGGAPTIALGAGTVADIATPAERGTYMGLVSAGPMLGPCIGPVFGGLINSKWGWRGIFWFLFIMGGGVLVPMVLFFPETLRILVGDGSGEAKGMGRTVWSLIAAKRESKARRDAGEFEEGPQPALLEVRKGSNPNPFDALKCVLEPDVAIILLYNGLCTANAYGVLAVLSTIMEDTYHLTTLQTGLTYLPFGVGMFTANLTTGRILDRDFRRKKKQMEDIQASADANERGSETEVRDEEKGDQMVAKQKPFDMLEFPLEHVRLKYVPIYSPIFWGSIIGFGWATRADAPLAVTLFIGFIIGYTSMATLQITQVLMIDLYPGRGASIAANSNLFRSLISAVFTAVVDPLRRGVGLGWTMTIFASISIASSPLLVLEYKYGQRWRKKRAQRIKDQEEKKKIENDEHSRNETAGRKSVAEVEKGDEDAKS